MNEFWNFVKLNKGLVAKEVLKTVFGVCKVLFVVAVSFLIAFMLVNLPLVWFFISMAGFIFSFTIAIRLGVIYENYRIRNYKPEAVK